MKQEETQIVVTFGHVTQRHWLTVVREYLFHNEVVFAELLFKLW
jgi:hypothetical protein